nr:hypothetical protein [Endozoicomonas sp.]
LYSATLSVHAINKSTVINKTDQKIAVAWTALGCLHDVYQHGQVCAGRILAPGHSHRYQYNWGATNDHIHIGGFFKRIGLYAVIGSAISFDPNNRGPYSGYSATIGGNCRLSSPDKKVVIVNSITIDDHQWTVNCDYSIHNMYDSALFSKAVSKEH